MKARDRARKAVISMLIADVKKDAIDVCTREDISDVPVDQVILNFATASGRKTRK